MNLRQRLLKRYLPVALILAVMGYLLAETFLMVQQIYGGQQDPRNAQVRWRTPLTMAGFGLILLVAIEGITTLIRRRPTVGAPAVALDDPTSPTDKHPVPTP